MFSDINNTLTSFHEFAHDFNTNKRKKEKETEFNRGYILACCNIQNILDQPGVGWEAINQLNISQTEIDKLDLSEHDQRTLEKIRLVKGGLENDCIRKQE